MSERCQGITQTGQPCSASPRPGGSFCAWHDPEYRPKRAEWSRIGGQNRSNEKRARKAVAGDLRDLGTVQAAMLKALKGLEDGTVEPGVATAMATVARSLVAVAQANAAVNLEQQLADMARQIAELNERQPA